MSEIVFRRVVDDGLVLGGVAFKEKFAVGLEVVSSLFEDAFDDGKAVIIGIKSLGRLVV